MCKAEIEALAERLMEAIRTGDVNALAEVYAPDITVWHTFDCRDQTRDESLRTMVWMNRHVTGIEYRDVRRVVVDDGFVQQQTMVASDPPFSAPCMFRAWCSDGQITRIEEYLDSAHVKAVRDMAAEHVRRRHAVDRSSV